MRATMTTNPQTQIESRPQAMMRILRKGLKRFWNALMAMAVRFHDTPAKQQEPKVGKAKSLKDRRNGRRQKTDTFDRRGT